MQENNLTTLRLQIENLLHSHQRLQQENDSLRIKMAKLIQERAVLIGTKDKIRKQLKVLLVQVRNALS